VIAKAVDYSVPERSISPYQLSLDRYDQVAFNTTQNDKLTPEGFDTQI
jgi:hypothetical protein